MRQYLDAKQQYRDAILFFRMGDFYEMFYEDALVAARALDLTLTSRSKDGQGSSIPMCGIPHHAADTYLARLVKKGFRVAICDQVEDPRKAKGIVKRAIVRVVSPGTLTDSQHLDAREPAFLLSVTGSDPMTKNDRGSDPITKSVREALERISTLNPSLNAFITVFEADAMAQARVLDEEHRQGRTRGPVHGWIVSVKDLIDINGVPTTAASRSRLTHVAAADAPIISRLRQAGAVIIGKCNLHEFALGTTSDESAFGAVHNPRDVRRSPGGSSGGSAAAVTAAIGRASIGTDTGGSIRIPAAACGVVGLKPTFAEIPTAGVLPLSVSLDHAGPIARNVSDAWTLLGVLKGSGEIPSAPRPVSEITLGRLGGYFVVSLIQTCAAVSTQQPADSRMPGPPCVTSASRARRRSRLPIPMSC